jgi:hypothetical protein
MKRKLLIRLPTLTGIVVCVTVLAGCVTGTVMNFSGGTNLDKNKVALIKPGVTTLSEILEWFGPPWSIIDGTQYGLRGEFISRQPGTPLPAATAGPTSGAPRVVGVMKYVQSNAWTAPDGMVILAYGRASGHAAAGFAAVPVGGMASQTHVEAQGDAFLIYLSKKNRTVVKTEGTP